MTEEEDKLANAVNRLIKATCRSNSLGWMVLKGIFYSFGWIIGIGLIATILIYVLPKTGEGNIIGHFIRAMANALRQSQ